MNTPGTDQQEFIAGMRQIHPFTDQVTSTAASSTRNNGARRFSEPFLSATMAIVVVITVGRLAVLVTEVLEISTTLTRYHSCGLLSGFRCIANLWSRQLAALLELDRARVHPMNSASLAFASIMLDGLKSRHTEVVFTEIDSGAALGFVAVMYKNFSIDGLTFLNRYENVTIQSGETQATKITSDDGFRLTIDVLINNSEANGTLAATTNDTEYNSQQTAHDLPARHKHRQLCLQLWYSMGSIQTFDGTIVTRVCLSSFRTTWAILRGSFSRSINPEDAPPALRLFPKDILKTSPGFPNQYHFPKHRTTTHTMSEGLGGSCCSKGSSSGSSSDSSGGGAPAPGGNTSDSSGGGAPVQGGGATDSGVSGVDSN
ncbi:hypothetical protein F4801DRAFT_577654 [Xylaria longipes]|nr:hypothetical protein F4801DRAFT_577654 [Xylaria longipes]